MYRAKTQRPYCITVWTILCILCIAQSHAVFITYSLILVPGKELKKVLCVHLII